MSSENQQNTPQENEKIRQKLINIICLSALTVVVFILVFIIACFIVHPKDISQYKELLIIIIPIVLLALSVHCLYRRLNIAIFEKIKNTMKISSNVIFNTLIISCLATACSLNTLVTTSSEIIDDGKAQKRHQELKDEIQKMQCNKDNKMEELKFNIKNKEKESQIQDSNITTQPIKETQTQNNDVVTQQNKDINEKAGTSQKECECNVSQNIQEKDESINDCNESNNKNEGSSSENLEILAKILIIFGTAFFAFLSGYLFMLKGKVEDYLDYIDTKK